MIKKCSGKFVREIQKTTLPGTAHILRKVLSIKWSGADPGFFLGGGALVSCATSTPINHIVFHFLQNTSCIRKPQVISRGGGGAHPLHPPPRSAHEYPSRVVLRKQKNCFTQPRRCLKQKYKKGRLFLLRWEYFLSKINVKDSIKIADDSYENFLTVRADRRLSIVVGGVQGYPPVSRYGGLTLQAGLKFLHFSSPS